MDVQFTSQAQDAVVVRHDDWTGTFTWPLSDPLPRLEAGLQSALSAWVLAGGAPTAREVLEPEVIAERNRRLAAGFDYDFGDQRSVHRIGTTEADMRGWDEVSKFAEALRATGAGSTYIQLVTDTGPVAVTADEWVLILIAAGHFRQPIWAASFALQAMTPVPADYADDARWP